MKLTKYTRILLCFMLLAIISPISSTGREIKPSSTSLTIYTYDSLLADYPFDWVSAFESFANLPSGSVNVKTYPDAGTILTQAVVEKSNPIADVLIGLDNALVHKARAEDILTPYQPVNSSQLNPALVKELAPDYLLTPYDYGLISLYYDKTRITIDQNFTLQDLITQHLDKKLVVENPILSSTGLGFLLWTISVFGDPARNVTGLVNSNWKDFWSSISKNIRVADSWGKAFQLFTTPEADRPIMVSYATSPSYDLCEYNDSTTAALLSNEGGIVSGWKQIEGLGLVKNAQHQTLAKEFIDWFISPEVQNHIFESQWMYPAISGITQPSCYDKTYPIDSVRSLNSRISQNTLNSNLDTWLDEWEVAQAGNKSKFDVSYVMFLPIAILLFIRKRKKSKY